MLPACVFGTHVPLGLWFVWQPLAFTCESLRVPLWVLAIINKAIITNESVRVLKCFETNESSLTELLVKYICF